MMYICALKLGGFISSSLTLLGDIEIAFHWAFLTTFQSSH